MDMHSSQELNYAMMGKPQYHHDGGGFGIAGLIILFFLVLFILWMVNSKSNESKQDVLGAGALNQAHNAHEQTMLAIANQEKMQLQAQIQELQAAKQEIAMNAKFGAIAGEIANLKQDFDITSKFNQMTLINQIKETCGHGGHHNGKEDVDINGKLKIVLEQIATA